MLVMSPPRPAKILFLPRDQCYSLTGPPKRRLVLHPVVPPVSFRGLNELRLGKRTLFHPPRMDHFFAGELFLFFFFSPVLVFFAFLLSNARERLLANFSTALLSPFSFESLPSVPCSG